MCGGLLCLPDYLAIPLQTGEEHQWLLGFIMHYEVYELHVFYERTLT